MIFWAEMLVSLFLVRFFTLDLIGLMPPPLLCHLISASVFSEEETLNEALVGEVGETFNAL